MKGKIKLSLYIGGGGLNMAVLILNIGTAMEVSGQL